MGALPTAAQMYFIKATKYLLEFGEEEQLMPGLDNKERKALRNLIKYKLDNIEQLVYSGLLSISSESTAEKNPFAKGSFKMIFIPGTDIKLNLMIEPAAVRFWDSSKNLEGSHPLHLLCSLHDIPAQAIRDLFDIHPVDVNVTNSAGFTALTIAIHAGNFPVVKLLIEKGSHVNYAPAVPLTLDELGSYYPFLSVFSPVPMTCPRMHYYVTPVDAAVFANEEDILRYLVNMGAEVNANSGIWNNLTHPIVMGRRRIVELLLEGGVDVNGVDLMETSALHTAAAEGSIDLAHILMRRGAKVNAQDMYGWSPLHIACLLSRNVCLEMIQLLLDGGAEVEAETKSGFTPLCLAEAGNDLSFLEHLVNNMLRLDIVHRTTCMPDDRRREHEDIVTLLLDNGASCNHQDNYLGWTALHWAAASGDLRTAQLLLSRGAKVSIRSKLNLTPQQTALYFGKEQVSSYIYTFIDEAQADNLNSKNDLI
ncbi:unnamed protein product [Nezara viridula]|uniref:Uncharacterized protein n=1 Tax=Nezara viridula TaxID=85310 RepID=A0A9P0H8K0_NEZVI|nr:unnamed protein product [Nezara viridula]